MRKTYNGPFLRKVAAGRPFSAVVVGQLEHIEDSRECVVGRGADIDGKFVVSIGDGAYVAGCEQDVAGLPLMARAGLYLEKCK